MNATDCSALDADIDLCSQDALARTRYTYQSPQNSFEAVVIRHSSSAQSSGAAELMFTVYMTSIEA